MTTSAIVPGPDQFSLVLGGPSYQLLRFARLSGPTLESPVRRTLVITLFAWLPLLLLSAFEGHLLSGKCFGFLSDVESHARLLVALPILVIAELVVQRRVGPALARFVECGVITEEETPSFSAAIESATRTRNSVWPEASLLLFVFTVGHLIWRQGVAVGAPTWYAIPDGMGMHLTLAGSWFGFVSVPIFQFILLRWYLRLTIWFLLLWRVSRLHLRLLPTHPDRAGGIGFVGRSTYAFASILFAHGTLLAGLIASRIFYEGRTFKSFRLSIIGLVVFLLLVSLGPLTAFSPQLISARLRGLKNYGKLATVYCADFDEKWIRKGVRKGEVKAEEILGTADIQSLADLANTYGIVHEMRVVPFALRDVGWLAVTAAIPTLPLILTIVSFDEIISGVLKILF
jgi:hypothetical protein